MTDLDTTTDNAPHPVPLSFRAIGDDRRAIGNANYRGNVVLAIAAQIANEEPSGPNYMRELMWPVDATYDPDTNITRVGFCLIPPTNSRQTAAVHQ